MKLLIYLVSTIFLLQIAYAVPNLQLYIDGSVYVGDNPEPYLNESWYIEEYPYTLWIIGAVEQNVGIHDVRILFASEAPDHITGELKITPLSVDNSGALIGDRGTTTVYTFPNDFSYGVPMYDNGSLMLPEHEIYPARYVAYDIDPRLDFFDALYPVFDKVTNTDIGDGQQYAYEINITGDLVFYYLHMDAANHIVRTDGDEDAIYAPFDHDATSIPEFGTIGSVLAIIGAGAFALRNRKSDGFP